MSSTKWTAGFGGGRYFARRLHKVRVVVVGPRVIAAVEAAINPKTNEFATGRSALISLLAVGGQTQQLLDVAGRLDVLCLSANSFDRGNGILQERRVLALRGEANNVLIDPRGEPVPSGKVILHRLVEGEKVSEWGVTYGEDATTPSLGPPRMSRPREAEYRRVVPIVRVGSFELILAASPVMTSAGGSLRQLAPGFCSVPINCELMEGDAASVPFAFSPGEMTGAAAFFVRFGTRDLQQGAAFATETVVALRPPRGESEAETQFIASRTGFDVGGGVLTGHALVISRTVTIGQDGKRIISAPEMKLVPARTDGKPVLPFDHGTAEPTEKSVGSETDAAPPPPEPSTTSERSDAAQAPMISEPTRGTTNEAPKA